MFRDPSFYLELRKNIVPILKTYPFIRIWHAGCSTGEEVYSLAILLKEEEIYDRCRIYATDMNEEVLKKASEAIYPLSNMKDYTTNYLQAGGTQSFSDYYTAQYDRAHFSADLKKNIVFSHHNLATDESFNEFNLILCRNVMIYFNRQLQERVHKLIYESLAILGILGLGDKENIKFTNCELFYEVLNNKEKLYRKVR